MNQGDQGPNILYFIQAYIYITWSLVNINGKCRHEGTEDNKFQWSI